MNVRKLLCSLTIGKDILIFLQDELVLISLIFYRVAFLRDRNPLRPTAICMSTRSISLLHYTRELKVKSKHTRRCSCSRAFLLCSCRRRCRPQRRRIFVFASGNNFALMCAHAIQFVCLYIFVLLRLFFGSRNR